LSEQAPARKSLLEGIRVLDFTAVMAGPLCTRLLADLGAEVIKVEPPDGDQIRGRPPLREGYSTYFGQLNAGKRSLVLDLKKQDAIEAACKLAEVSDIVVENFRPGVMVRIFMCLMGYLMQCCCPASRHFLFRPHWIAMLNALGRWESPRRARAPKLLFQIFSMSCSL